MTQTQPTSIPYNGSGTINIHINNPSASLGGAMLPYAMPMMPYPAYYPYFCYPPAYYLDRYKGGVTQTTNVTHPQSVQQALQQSYPKDNVSGSSDKNKKRQVVILTDNYIKNLENYLRNPSVELRKSAVKEILDRFKEDKSRLNNPSLTALLNLALQDPNPTVKAVAMSILSSGYAQGNSQTEQILKNIQASKTNYSADAIQAADSLLKMSQTKMTVPDNSHYPPTNNNNKKGT